eukprot:4003301-Alexandrium_andersonii.AAC.1
MWLCVQGEGACSPRFCGTRPARASGAECNVGVRMRRCRTGLEGRQGPVRQSKPRSGARGRPTSFRLITLAQGRSHACALRA